MIIGGGAAGSSAALVLGRARARVLLIDAGQPSNIPSTGIGGLLGNDGITPADFYKRASDELAVYPTVDRRSATLTAIHPDGTPKWRLELDDGPIVHTDRLLLAIGMHYALPDIDGIQPRWGSSVFHCPFCHGWEHRDQPLAVLEGPLERALLLRRWSDDLTLITGGTTLTEEQQKQLARAGIGIIDGEVESLHGPGRDLDKISLRDGTTLAVTGLLVPAPHQLRSPPLLDGLGFDTTPTGHLAVDVFGATNVPGIWAAGDLTHPVGNVSRAIAGGSNSAIGITHNLVASHTDSIQTRTSPGPRLRR